MLKRTLQEKPRRDYLAMSKGTKYTTSSSEEDELDISVERELVEDDMDLLDLHVDEDEEFPEEGELVEEDEEEQPENRNVNALIKKYTSEGDLNKLK